jgi:hypothetical protein
LSLSLSRGMNSLSFVAEMAIRRMWIGCHSGNARALGSRRNLTQNRYPRLLKALLVAGFFR